MVRRGDERPRRENRAVNLSFLGGRAYQLLLARDNLEEPGAIEIERGSKSRGDSIGVAMRAGGGFIMRLQP